MDDQDFYERNKTKFWCEVITDFRVKFSKNFSQDHLSFYIYIYILHLYIFIYFFRAVAYEWLSVGRSTLLVCRSIE